MTDASNGMAHRGKARRNLADVAAADWSEPYLLPVQYFAPGRGTMRPEARLALAVLDEAIQERRRRDRSGMRRARRRADDVDAWFRSDDASWPFSFASICSVLGLDPSFLRARLRREDLPDLRPCEEKIA